MRQQSLLLPELKNEDMLGKIDGLLELQAQMDTLATFTGYLAYEGGPVFITVFINKKSSVYSQGVLKKTINFFKAISLKQYEWY